MASDLICYALTFLAQIYKTCMDNISAIIIGVLSSFIASCIFLYVMFKLKPKMAISDRILIKSKSGNRSYIIKVINKTKRPIINIRASLSIVNKINIGEGYLRVYKNITLKNSELFELSKYDPYNKNATYTYRFVTNYDIDSNWDDDRAYLRFRVISTHSFSNFSKVFNQLYYKKDVLKDGEFKYGDSFEII